MELSQLSNITEPQLEFNISKASPLSVHPLEGLKNFGPYSADLFPIDKIRIATIHLKGTEHLLRKLFAEFEKSHLPKERKKYLPVYEGFKKIFRAEIFYQESVSLSLEADKVFNSSQEYHISLSDTLGNAIRSMSQRTQDYDILVIYLPEIWSKGFEDFESNFDLHDFLKAATAIRNIPTQIVTENGALRYRCRCSVMWRLSVAFYVKAGGTPWKLATIDNESAFIGLSYSARKNPVTEKFDFITCCSQVFDSDGTGLEFLAYDTSGIESTQGANPFLTRGEMRKVMSKSLALYQRRHSGRLPKRLIVHKTTHFTKNEIDGAFDAIPANVELELLQIIQDTPWRGIKYNNYGKWKNDTYPINRGSYLVLNSREILFWTQGIVKINGKSFFKEGKGIPSPLLIRRHAGSGGWDQNCQAILGLTKMNWNHDGLYDRLPVTLGFASVLARTIKRMLEVKDKAYEFKYFM
ncbi:hypothetical protein [Leeuwenhoekiella marinoflava]|uniref:argonaute/piwi family protein n=1 Tax=Leeuwenhoekiella marinoflava TaxID=988 RepID=UPI0030030978